MPRKSGVPDASDIPFLSNAPTLNTTIRSFRRRGEGEYSLEVPAAGITFFVTRLRRESHALHGELTVSVTREHFPNAHTIEDHTTIAAADMNLSTLGTRKSWAKEISQRCGPEGNTCDWLLLLEEFCVKVIHAEREGEPSVILADFPKNGDDNDSWTVEGFPLLRRHPTVLFGKGASGKSLFALWLAGALAIQGVAVAYFDWELAGDEHRTRLDSLFQPAPRNLHYVLCRAPLRERFDHIKAVIRQHQCRYAVFDSMGPASRAHGGRFQDGDLGQEYFGLIRQLPVGTLHVAHPPKHTADEKDSTIYGSAFFDYLARAVWFVKATENNKAGQITMGLYHQKQTTGKKLSPTAYRIIFTDTRTRVEPTDLKAIEELVAGLPLLERIKQKLEIAHGPLTIKVLATDLDIPQNTLRKTIARHLSMFTRLDRNTVALSSTLEDF